MMPPILKTAPQVVQVALKGTNPAGRNHVNTIHLLYSTSSLDASEGAEIAQDVSSLWQDEVLDVLNVAYAYTGATWIDLNSITGNTGTVSPTPAKPTNGQTTNPGGAPQVCLLVKKNIVGSGRGHRGGRMFLSPFDEAEVSTAGNITTSTLSLWQTKINNFWSGLDAIIYGGGSEVTVCQPHWLGVDKPTEAVGGEWPAVSVSVSSGFTVDGKCATQRRRNRG
jgi:hypothetical protein